MDRVPVLRVGDLLLVTLQPDIHDRIALALEDDLSRAIVTHGAHGVLIDISALDVVDSFIGRTLGSISSVARLLSAETVVTGMRPAVAMTMVEMGVSLTGIRTAIDLQSGIDRLRRERDGGERTAGLEHAHDAADPDV